MAKPRFLAPEGQGIFHEGELFVQAATGERAIAERNSRMMSSAVPPSPAAFLAQQRMLVVASVDEAGALWASLIFGPAGFANAEGEVVRIDRQHAQIAADDALLGNLQVGAMLGILAIELASRRRYRINGFVSAASNAKVEISVREAYVNCPKYIQRRHLCETGEPAVAGAATAHGTVLDAERQALIRRADTMFVASRHPARGADASHRGGEPGFLELRDERTVRVPEYAGNGLYNTLGNLVVSNKAGLAVVDFEAGRVLQLTGSATVVLEGHYWDFVVARWTELALPKTFRWELLDRSPFNPALPV